mmetsp:Transcript_21775/g.35967  ORF Transcript_21775/g.35967 Transcript_21775/m.35967 type:complete len:932 (-) Transcript_21775:841-3636(-)|eukprot:CAMPEP_0119029736 /NCGR_PEP_ID=MMETSP1176-20130426/40671_1 /TAXON_ID=265551 /ORGANISM="Synedropsis recta cf, Strain CCMP1620" /LENGTH=931 /DNA_ID=CAMNT_0006986089 /DNA_START=1339 /DNA_END=4134 /DNA_ORIENTATION=-
MNMWGDPETAATLDESSDDLVSLLFQICGPAHIPWHDARWQELLLHYNVWVHMEHTRQHAGDGVVTRACASMAKHAVISSNLAALCLHASRMIRELQGQQQQQQQATTATTSATNNSDNNKNDFTNKIALVGKARATAGSLTLLRTLIHDVPPAHLAEALLYRSRDEQRSGGERMAGHELVTCLLNFLSSSSNNNNNLAVPEMYDATVIVLQLLLVLLSSQLYQPMVSSFEQGKQQRSSNGGNNSPVVGNSNYILDYIMEDARRRRRQSHHNRHDQQEEPQQDTTSTTTWSPQTLLQTCMSWQLQRPTAPPRSIAHHSSELIQAVIAAKSGGESTTNKVGPDGMYESHVVVMAEKPKPVDKRKASSTGTTTDLVRHHHQKRTSSTIFFDATKGVVVLSSSLMLLPFRLLTLALGLLGRGSGRSRGGPEYDQLRKKHIANQNRQTNDVLWITKSPIADLSTSLLLILVHNYRAGADNSNPFRAELSVLNDNRWDEMKELSSATTAAQEEEESSQVLLGSCEQPLLQQQQQEMSTNFENLFATFGSIVHTEVGALLLYTMYQSSPVFAQSMAVRSDLDTLVVPLLRTLYFSSSLRHYHCSNTTSSSSTATVKSPNGSMALSPRNCPFRSPSQLYLILILLLLFSQDSSFGPDAFRRVMVSSVPWYRERNLKEITLGSLLLLTLLRSITFNLNRLQDAFLLSNCCAVLMNLSPNVVQLHDYAAMRLVAVTISSLKKYATFLARNDGKDDDDLTTPVGMYGEVARTLLGVLRHCLGPKNLDKNLHLIYSLVYSQTEFKELVENPNFLKGQTAMDLMRVQKVIQVADQIIHDDGNARTAPKAFQALESNIDKLKEVSEQNNEADFTFSYEEETDPEIFFVPYIWEVVVCVVTASTVDWDTNRIEVFPLLEEEDDSGLGGTEVQEMKGFAEDVSDVV